MLEKCVSPRRDAPIHNICCFIEGKHHFSKQSFRLGHIHVFKFMCCFAMAKQHFQHVHVNQKGSMGKHKPWIKPRQPRFQNQWIAKTIENTQNNKKTKISEPMGSQNHREYKQQQTKQDFRINDSGSRSFVLKSCCFCLFLYSRWFSLPIGSEIVFFVVLLFSMVLATHWF